MLTRHDLQNIGEIVREEIKPLKVKIKSIDKRLSHIEEDIVEIKDNMEKLTEHFAEDYLDLAHRVEKLEKN